ncbi:acetylornithine transaminase [Nocardioides endophyticus]|uniref:Acetylornithine aminotransferase n=1 Tax=Nocardioides endophyticus TaxID=1353775 RepID=A0ABP8Z0J3_9ACTN
MSSELTVDWQRRWQSSVMNTYGTPSLALVYGEGINVFDTEGRRFVDFTGGIAVNTLGHRHPAIIRAVSEQVGRLCHTSNLFMTPGVVELAERLTAHLAQPAKAFFCNSGTEANEAALKISRRTGRPKIVAAEGGFHGRTLGALSVTGQPAKQDPFTPLLPDVQFVPYGDSAALERAVDDRTAAVVLEPILGEGGIVVPPAGYLSQARRITREYGSLLVLDEVQTGVARTGSFFAHEREGIDPDVVTLAKGLAGGLPIGVCLATEGAADLLQPGDHGATFGGNAVSVAAAHAVLDEIDSAGLVDHAAQIGRMLRTSIEHLQHPMVASVRGAGLLIGLELSSATAGKVVQLARDSGYLLNAATPNVVRLAPPLIVTSDDVQRFVSCLPAILDRVVK